MEQSNGHPIPTTNGNRLVRNEFDEETFPTGLAPYLLRQSWLQALVDPRRDLDKECGYPYLIIPKMYRYMYEREGIASRVVSIYPDECWAVDPEVYETEGHDESPFERAWNDLLLSPENNPLHYCHRIDVLSGVGRYGLLLLGVDDGADLSEPLPGVNERGERTPIKRPYKLLYMRAFDESLAHVILYEKDQNNPRFGRPLLYHCMFADVRVGDPGMATASVSVTSRIVHWSRVQHVADNRETSEVFGVPRMQPVFNRLCDIRKILGGSAEMFWKGGFPGFSFELDPALTTAGVTLDNKSLRRQFDDYANGLSRYLAIVGLQTKSLAPQVANPAPSLDVQLNSVAMSIGCPLRIFAGSEQAQLASGQDVRTWNRRLTRRHNRYLSPMLLRPLVNRFISLGILPEPETGRPFKIHWPDINLPSAQERSQIADRQTAAIHKYITCNGFQYMAPMEFTTMVLGFSSAEAATIAEGINNWKAGITPPTVQVADISAEASTEVAAMKPAPTVGGF